MVSCDSVLGAETELIRRVGNDRHARRTARPVTTGREEGRGVPEDDSSEIRRGPVGEADVLAAKASLANVHRKSCKQPPRSAGMSARERRSRRRLPRRRSPLSPEDEASAAAVRQAAPAERLEDVAARLKEAVGAEWHPYTMPAGSAPLPSVDQSPRLVRHDTHYEILAASPADRVGKPPADGRLSAMALEVIATNGGYTVLSQPGFEPETAAKILAALGIQDPAKGKSLPSAAEWRETLEKRAKVAAEDAARFGRCAGSKR